MCVHCTPHHTSQRLMRLLVLALACECECECVCCFQGLVVCTAPRTARVGSWLAGVVLLRRKPGPCTQGLPRGHLFSLQQPSSVMHCPLLADLLLGAGVLWVVACLYICCWKPAGLCVWVTPTRGIWDVCPDAACSTTSALLLTSVPALMSWNAVICSPPATPHMEPCPPE